MKTLKILAICVMTLMTFSCKEKPIPNNIVSKTNYVEIRLPNNAEVKLSKAGKLEKSLGISQENIDSLTIYGTLNERDMVTLKYMENLSYLDLQNATIEGNSIRPWAFTECHKLHTVKLPNNISVIGYKAFSGCENLKTLIMPNSISIKPLAFEDCWRLPDSITRKRVYVNYQNPIQGHTVKIKYIQDFIKEDIANLEAYITIDDSTYLGVFISDTASFYKNIGVSFTSTAYKQVLSVNNKSSSKEMNDVDSYILDFLPSIDSHLKTTDNLSKKGPYDVCKKNLLSKLKNFSTAIIAVDNIQHYMGRWERMRFTGTISEDSVAHLIKHIYFTDYSALKDPFIEKKIDEYKKNMLTLLNNEPSEENTKRAYSHYKAICKQIYKRYPYDNLCSLNEDTFQMYIDKNRYMQNPNWEEYFAMNKNEAINHLKQRITQAVDFEEKVLSILAWIEITNYELRSDDEFDNDSERAPHLFAYQRIMKQNKYSIYLMDTWENWRRYTQSIVYGNSRDSDIPIHIYNQMRNQCLETIYQHIENNPNDQMAIYQYYAMAADGNISTNGNLFGNGNLFD